MTIWEEHDSVPSILQTVCNVPESLGCGRFISEEIMQRKHTSGQRETVAFDDVVEALVFVVEACKISEDEFFSVEMLEKLKLRACFEVR
eukprot:CAMPEP_0197544712 /NCGR_PEP_ID=MMETSP1318-20131121/68916_1 /TAXON_ID=552666 /ORGANISM="Partenskyella glossopodia, Strain RCC365" /LENGTH=88 /DNA_ID=CAMNT_0043104129 /DNA_START=471 /DNA_END=737 /DNA_ORIENTATION=+